jgi:hypothetical protein
VPRLASCFPFLLISALALAQPAPEEPPGVAGPARVEAAPAASVAKGSDTGHEPPRGDATDGPGPGLVGAYAALAIGFGSGNAGAP